MSSLIKRDTPRHPFVSIYNASTKSLAHRILILSLSASFLLLTVIFLARRASFGVGALSLGDCFGLGSFRDIGIDKASESFELSCAAAAT